MKPTIRNEGTERELVRRFRTLAERNEYVALFAKSGLSVAAFCRHHGLCEQTFYNWRKRASRIETTAPASGPQFAQVVAPASATGAICIHLATDLHVEVAAGTDAGWLGEVVRELRSQG